MYNGGTNKTLFAKRNLYLSVLLIIAPTMLCLVRHSYIDQDSN
jgi:hypothetical protein